MVRSALSRGPRAAFAMGLAACVTACIAPPFPTERDARAAGLEEIAVAANTGRLRSWRAGDPAGPRVLFVHGTPGEGAQWTAFMERPPAGWDLVAPDRPGFGDSEPSAAVTALERQAAALHPLLVRRRGTGTTLVGHSLGAPIAAIAAARYPELVDGLVLIAGSMDPEQEKLRWYNQLVRVIPFLFPRFLRNSNAEVLPLRDELAGMEEVLAAIECPVLIIHGREDGLVPFANVPWMQARLVRAEEVSLQVFPKAGHLLIWQAPYFERVRTALQGFLAPPGARTRR